MQLVQIKLSGFKSFVDPTTIKIPSHMVGVVGPNGCGKSNIIDAVRWVLGESRAAELRGGSMHDVIFNGSGQRQPAARASVELVFDNSQQRLPGQWGAYNELSVRRTLAREEGSRYFINNQQVRRRDIYDIFLGTGLGARGYAIIGQGMINRLIEARPEELRVYLEEAAGVSRYKERRRETENRLADAQENLHRLNDLLREIEQQLERLQQQAEQAQRYQELQQQGQRLQHTLWRQEERAAAEQRQQHAQALDELENQVQVRLSDLRALQARLAGQQEQYDQVSTQVQATQTKLYEANTQVSSAQAEVRYVQANQQRSVQRRTQLNQQIEHWAEQQRQAGQALQDLQAQQLQAEQALDEAQAQLEHTEGQLEQLESQLQDEHQLREEHRQLMHREEQRRALLMQRYEDGQAEARKMAQQRIELESQQKGQFALSSEAPAHLLGAIEHARSQLQVVQKRLLEAEEALPQEIRATEQAEAQWHEQQKQQTALSERLNALQEIQGQWSSSDTLDQWLSQQNLPAAERLWSLLQVTPGWETAVESLLSKQVGALWLGDFQRQSLSSLNLSPPKAVHLWGHWAQQWPTTQPWHGLQPLTHYVQSQNLQVQAVLNLVFQQVWAVPDWQQGLNLAPELPPGACLVLPEGHLLTSTGVGLYAPEDEQAGAVARQQEIKRLQKTLQAEAVHEGQLAERVQQQRQGLEQAQKQIQTDRQRLQELSAHLHKLELEKAEHEQQAARQRERQQYIATELEALTQRQAQLEEQVAHYAEELDALEAVAESARQAFIDSDERCQELGGAVEELRQQLRGYERSVHQWQQEQQRLLERDKSLSERLQQALEQQEQLQQEQQQLQMELVDFDVAAVQAELDQALEKRQQVERQWEQVQAQQKIQHDALAQLKEDETRCAAQIGPLREKISALQLKEQEARLRVEQYQQQLQAEGVDREALDRHMAELPDKERQKTWLNKEIKRVQQSIEAMGAVNLAALQELAAAQERHKYLLAQHDDLITAIETLENAIRKIDRETRALLWQTFEQVNSHFGQLFPQLFGGGEAKLVMMGDEVLEAGVQVMAQPPGKRNATIALLSGGEKALTAIALVFAFFKLNPAPFCLLDEVDAPLDDANAERYAKLVQGMSEQTRFLFVTHNKITMQLAEHLIGVTMQEQGVSRIVSVDMQAAAELAEA